MTPKAVKPAKPIPPAAAARIAAGFTLAEAAKEFGLSVSYLKRLESSGAFGFCLAQRASFVYGANMFSLPHPTGRRTARKPRRSKRHSVAGALAKKEMTR